MRRLYCRKCGYDLTPLFQGDVVEAPCPECGSIAEMRRAGAIRRNWWLGPALGALVVGVIPLLCAVLAFLNWSPARYSPLMPWLWPYFGPILACLAAFIIFPRDVPGRASFGRLCPYLVLIFVASIAVNVVLAFAWVMTMVWISAW